MEVYAHYISADICFSMKPLSTNFIHVSVRFMIMPSVDLPFMNPHWVPFWICYNLYDYWLFYRFDSLVAWVGWTILREACKLSSLLSFLERGFNPYCFPTAWKYTLIKTCFENDVEAICYTPAQWHSYREQRGMDTTQQEFIRHFVGKSDSLSKILFS